MIKICRLLILILIQKNILFAAIAETDNKPYIGEPTPEWVVPLEISGEPIPLKPSQVNFQMLLVDEQNHTEKNTCYVHKAYKILTQAGAEQNSQLCLDYHPSNQTFHMHSLRIFRNGTWFDRLESTKYKIIQKEKDLSHNIYSGTLSVVYFFDDLRVGDIVEFSCSWVHCNPILNTHFSASLYLQESTSAEKIFYRILTPPSKPLAHHSFNTTQTPQIRDLSDDLQEWIWETANTPPVPREENQPGWFNPYARVHVTQYKDWKEIVCKVLPMYEFSFDYPLEEMETLIDSWKSFTASPLERAALALQFVQDEIRYLGIRDEADGLGGVKPAHPYVVFERRFGDCKEKTVLLQALLRLMDISSQPILVHTRFGTLVQETVPSPWIFNHVILQITIDGKNYFVDPTCTLQGGSLENRYCPDYGWGLPISPASEGLIPFPHPPITKSVDIEISVQIHKKGHADIEITIAKCGNQADRMRQNLEYSGLQIIEESFLKELKKIYGAAKAVVPLKIEDERGKNIFTTKGTYRVPLKNRIGAKSLKVQSQTLSYYLLEGLNADRTSPLAQEYPLWVEEHISCKLDRWENKHESRNVFLANDSVSFRYVYEEKEGDIDIRYQLKNFKDHIPPNSIEEYWNMLDEIQSQHVEEIKYPN